MMLKTFCAAQKKQLHTAPRTITVRSEACHWMELSFDDGGVTQLLNEEPAASLSLVSVKQKITCLHNGAACHRPRQRQGLQISFGLIPVCVTSALYLYEIMPLSLLNKH